MYGRLSRFSRLGGRLSLVSIQPPSTLMGSLAQSWFPALFSCFAGSPLSDVVGPGAGPGTGVRKVLRDIIPFFRFGIDVRRNVRSPGAGPGTGVRTTDTRCVPFTTSLKS